MKHLLLFCLSLCLLTQLCGAGTAHESETQRVRYRVEEPLKPVKVKKGKVIYLNGPSSAGKSSLTLTLQQELSEPYLQIGIDTMIAMMPEKINNWTGKGEVPLGYSWSSECDENGTLIKTLSVGPYAQRMEPLLREIVRTLVGEGHNVIVDDVAFGKEEADAWHKALEDACVVWIGLYAPIEVLEEREKRRGDRIVGSARAQAALVHQGVRYDLEFDTSRTTDKEMVAAILKLQQQRCKAP